MRVPAAVLFVALALGLAAAPAGAAQASAAEVRALAVRAIDDPAALATLRSVDRVDGRPVDLVSALGGVDGDALRARLRALAGGASSTGGEASARSDATRILASSEFHARHTPRPLRGVLAWIGDRLRPLGRPFTWLIHWVEDHGAFGFGVLGVVVTAVAATAAALVVRSRGNAVVDVLGGRRRSGQREDPAELERGADAAEAAGDLEGALRLRFTAGLLRLDRAGALVYRPSLTTGAARRAVPVPSLGPLADALDQIVYGRRPAEPGDLAEARRRWPDVLAEASR